MSDVAVAERRRRRWQPADLLCGAGLGAGLVLSYVMAVLTPSLIARHVVLLEALTGSILSIVTGGAFARVGKLSPALVVLAPLCGVVIYDVFTWWAGRRWGRRIADLYARRRGAARTIERAESLVRRRGLFALAVAYYLPVPNGLLYFACGTSDMSLLVFVIGDIIGTLLWEALLVGLGWAIGHRAVGIVTAISHHATEVTLGLVAVWLVVHVVRRRGAHWRRPWTRQEGREAQGGPP